MRWSIAMGCRYGCRRTPPSAPSNSFGRNCHLPTVAVRLNRNHHIGRPVANVLHFHLDRGFEFGDCLARFFHGSIDPTRNIKFVARLIGPTLSLANLRDTGVFYAFAADVKEVNGTSRSRPQTNIARRDQAGGEPPWSLVDVLS